MPRRDASPKPRVMSKSGATGGSATTRGVNYQYDYAVLQALELIEEVLAAPHHHFDIQMEPRVGQLEDVTRWDFAVKAPGEVIELKLDPSKADILETLARAKAAKSQRVRLVYNSGSGPLLVVLDQLVRLATEASGDQVRFEELVQIESVRNRDVVLDILGPTAASLLNRFQLVPLPADALERQIDFLARRLAGEEKKKSLRDYLFHRFAKASPGRQTIAISALIDELAENKVELSAPLEIHPDDLSSAAIATVGVLQECVTGLPREVVTEAIKFQEPAERDLSSLIEGGVLSLSDEIALTRLLRSRFHSDDHPTAVADVLKALLTYISQHTGERIARRQVYNAVQLAKAVLPSNPELAAGVFPVVEKILKRAGNKHLVLEVAALTLAAAKRSSPSRGVTEMRALALICGVSWAYQRLDCLRDARAAGEKSMELGESIGWPRNTAFCLKCLGRLYRLEAGRATDATERSRLFAKSEESLHNAMAHFVDMKDFGPEHPQVGDCNALLARTFLVQGKLRDAQHAIQVADSLITELGSKEHLDVVILKGDLAVALNRPHAAEALYTEALTIVGDDDDERTEMCARAHLQRGRNRRKLGDTVSARLDFSAAAKIWRELNEPKLAAEADLEDLPIRDSLGADSRELLLSQPALVALTTFRLHAAETESLPVALAQRDKDPGVKYWSRLIRQAAAKVAIEYPEP